MIKITRPGVFFYSEDVLTVFRWDFIDDGELGQGEVRKKEVIKAVLLHIAASRGIDLSDGTVGSERDDIDALREAAAAIKAAMTKPAPPELSRWQKFLHWCFS